MQKEQGSFAFIIRILITVFISQIPDSYLANDLLKGADVAADADEGLEPVKEL